MKKVVGPTPYLDDLAERIRKAPGCHELADAAREALDSIGQAIADAEEEVERLAVLVKVPTDLPGVIKWIKAQVQQYVGPYQTYMQQIALYTAKLVEIQTLLVQKANQLACTDIPTAPQVPVVPKVKVP